jgi:hypothetical protein
MHQLNNERLFNNFASEVLPGDCTQQQVRSCPYQALPTDTPPTGRRPSVTCVHQDSESHLIMDVSPAFLLPVAKPKANHADTLRCRAVV